MSLLPVSVLFGALLGFLLAGRVEVRGRWARPLAWSGLILGGAALGGSLHFVLELALWMTFSGPGIQGKALGMSMVMQGVGAWWLTMALPTSVDRSTSPPVPGVVRDLTATARSGSPLQQWLLTLTGISAVGALYLYIFITLSPPYPGRMVALLWLQPLIGMAALFEAGQGTRNARMTALDVVARVGLAVVLLGASYVGLRLHQGLPLPIL